MARRRGREAVLESRTVLHELYVAAAAEEEATWRWRGQGGANRWRERGRGEPALSEASHTKDRGRRGGGRRAAEWWRRSGSTAARKEGRLPNMADTRRRLCSGNIKDITVKRCTGGRRHGEEDGGTVVKLHIHRRMEHVAEDGS